MPVELICQLPRRLSYLALLLVSRRNSIISPFLQPAYVVILLLPRSVVRGSAVEVIVAGTCSCRGSQSCNYRAVLEMMVKVKCKLTGIEITLSSYGRCAPYCRSRVSKPNKKRNPIFKMLLCGSISFLSRLRKTCDYISLKLTHSFFSGIIHFIEDRQRALNWGLAKQRTL